MNRYVPTLAVIKARRGRDGYLCMQCHSVIAHLPRLWAHKILRRHPFRSKAEGAAVVYMKSTTSTIHTFKWTNTT